MGFDKVLWEAQRANSSGGQAVRLTYTSKDGEEARARGQWGGRRATRVELHVTGAWLHRTSVPPRPAPPAARGPSRG